MKTPILKMTNIVKEFPGVKALDGVNIELHEGNGSYGGKWCRKIHTYENLKWCI